jgi:hypothetical protein
MAFVRKSCSKNPFCTNRHLFDFFRSDKAFLT